MRLDTTSRRLLTKDVTQGGVATGVLCDIKGNALQSGQEPISVYTDLLTGKAFARIASVIPSNADPTSQAAADAIKALDPVHYDSADAAERGWYVPAPDFTPKPVAAE